MSTTCNGMTFFLANFMLQTPNDNEQHHHPLPTSSISPVLPQDFHGIAPTLGKRSMPFSGIDMPEDTNNNNNNRDDDSSDEGSQMGGIGEKKRRLNMEQVKTLEKNFELGNKLEPERKMQLAKALGLQPRQIAIWFQNRRARWKTKQLEKDYDLLKTQFDALKLENDALLAQNQKLQDEITVLKNKKSTESINLNKNTEGSYNNKDTENSSKIKLDMSKTPTTTIDLSPLNLSRPATATATRFPTSAVRPNGPLVAQVLFQSPQEAPPLKGENNFTNMICGMDDQSTFWPLLEQPNFN